MSQRAIKLIILLQISGLRPPFFPVIISLACSGSHLIIFKAFLSCIKIACTASRRVFYNHNDNFLNCTVLESLLEYASSIPLYSKILVPPGYFTLFGSRGGILKSRRGIPIFYKQHDFS